MARWLKINKALEVTRVWNKVLRLGESVWRKRMAANAVGAKTFARYASGVSQGSGVGNMEVDVDNANVRT